MKAIQEISSLRFIFIIAIFLHHTIAYTGGGYVGVEFFFVLGGFVMTLGYKDRISGSEFSYKPFLFKRMAKYYPDVKVVLIGAKEYHSIKKTMAVLLRDWE